MVQHHEWLNNLLYYNIMNGYGMWLDVMAWGGRYTNPLTDADGTSTWNIGQSMLA